MLREGVDPDGYWLEYFIEDDDENVLGSAQFMENYDEVNCGGTIYHFEVDDGCRELGVGNKLMTTMLGRLSNNKITNVRIIMGEHPSFEIVEKFLKKHGFKDIRKSEMYFAIEAIRG